MTDLTYLFIIFCSLFIAAILIIYYGLNRAVRSIVEPFVKEYLENEKGLMVVDSSYTNRIAMVLEAVEVIEEVAQRADTKADELKKEIRSIAAQAGHSAAIEQLSDLSGWIQKIEEALANSQKDLATVVRRELVEYDLSVQKIVKQELNQLDQNFSTFEQALDHVANGHNELHKIVMELRRMVMFAEEANERFSAINSLLSKQEQATKKLASSLTTLRKAINPAKPKGSK